MYVYDTLSRKKIKFKSIRKNVVYFYTCGPSVYSTPHLGNFRTYVFEDVVKRTLKFLGYEVRHVMNITDIEDKAVRAAKGNLKKLLKITQNNTKVFIRNSNELGILPPDIRPKATRHIKQMVKLIKQLLKNKMAYKDEKGNVFFDVSSFSGYGRLSGTRFKRELGGRVYKDDYYQFEAGDFLLWKAWKKGDGDIYWKTELGKGRPGWHIECSAMSMYYLGEQFDIHMGGIDNVFSHHENEIAQSESVTGSKLANYWIHVRHLLIEGKKMSKSLGNFYTVEDIHRMGYRFDAIRFTLMGEHYRKRLNFTFKGLEECAQELKYCKARFSALKRGRFWKENPVADKRGTDALLEFKKYLENDLDISNAIGVFCSYLRKVEEFIKKKQFGDRNAKRACEVVEKMDSVMGLIEEC
ncbi:cysteine--tRNA ligase [Candidatus Micrarchaeota archaeon]|nr:cysteine--tRNA ligase [Candidatus Micrarchaeota archaeon]